MNTPLSPAWTQAFNHANWASPLTTALTPAALTAAAAAQAPDGWQQCAYQGAARASTLLQSPAPWLAQGVVLGARAAGIATGAVGAGMAAYPLARLAFGTGIQAKAAEPLQSRWSQLTASGIFGLPECACLSAAQSRIWVHAPKCRTALLGLAVGLRALIQVPRALVGLVGLAAAVCGAGFGVVAHAYRRAVAALKRMPEQAGRIITQLQTQKAQLEAMVSAGMVYWARAQGLAQAASQTWARAAEPMAALRIWAAQAPAALMPLLKTMPSRPAASTQQAASGVTPDNVYLARLRSSAHACVQSAQMGAHYVRQAAEAGAEAVAGAQQAARYATELCTRLQSSAHLAEGFAALSDVVASLPFGARTSAA